jgi:uncharacterized protein (TIRG00374 family)
MPVGLKYARTQSYRKIAVRSIVSICLIALLFTQISVEDVISNLKRVSPLFILFAWAYYAICQWISAYRWQLLLHAKSVDVKISNLFAMYMIGMFVNNFMPGSLGGDVVKSYYLFRRTREMELAVVSVFLERFTGLVGLSILSLVALPFAYRFTNSPLVHVAVLGTMAIPVLMVLLFWQLPWIVRLMPWLARLLPQRFTATASGVYDALVSYRGHPATIFATVAISVVLQLLFAVYYALASLAMGVHIDFMYFVLFLPAVSLVSLIPLSIGGLGLCEATMVVLFSAAGVAPADVLSVSLTVHLINTVLSLWGGALMLTHPLNTLSPPQKA